MLYLFFLFVYNRDKDVFCPYYIIITHIFLKVKGIGKIKMKICAIICEYNPFHNGHLYQMSEAKRLSGADAVLCIMSGNFVQRGEAAILDKFTRAKHAILAGADAVIELPTIFATSNAELFAKGAIKLLSSIPSVTTLCFGAERAEQETFLHAATLLNDEPKEISAKIKELSAIGLSYAKARAQAWKDLLPQDLLSSPNNILGLEYTRAILSMNAALDILPIARVGGGYNEEALYENYSSASAIRLAIANKESFAGNLPDFVAKDLPASLESTLETLEKYALLSSSTEKIAKVCDCSEGLENALKKGAESPQSLVENLTSARYTASRIRRIALQNLLNIDEVLIRNGLNSALYLRVLAVKNPAKDILSALSNSPYPVIARPRDVSYLSGVAKDVFAVDTFAEKVYSLLYKQEKTIDVFI